MLAMRRRLQLVADGESFAPPRDRRTRPIGPGESVPRMWRASRGPSSGSGRCHNRRVKTIKFTMNVRLTPDVNIALATEHIIDGPIDAHQAGMEAAEIATEFMRGYGETNEPTHGG